MLLFSSPAVWSLPIGQVFDPVTGATWLSLALSQGTPMSNVGTLIGPGAPYEGFRPATKAEVDQLIVDFGLPIPTNVGINGQQSGFVAVPYSSANLFVNSFGQTGLFGFPAYQRASGGLFITAYGGNDTAGMIYEVQSGPLDGPDFIGRIRRDIAGPNSTGGFGLFLVRTVPSPSTIALLALGLVGIGVGLRKQA